jgi:branched-chain amino acid transport system substrate-binding protein
MRQSEALLKSSFNAYGTRMLNRKALWQTLILYIAIACTIQQVGAIEIGVVAPTSGPFARLGEQMLGGFHTAAEHLNVKVFNQDEVCTQDGGQAVAKALVARKVDMAVGFTCFESLNAALPILKDAGITTITTGVRADVLTDNKSKSEYLLYRLAPREDMEVAALISVLQQRWREENFAIIDDGTVLARNTAEALRFALIDSGLKPVFTDTFRPGLENQAALVRRLQKAGATHVFVGGDIEDALVISKAAKGDLDITIGESSDPQSESNGAGPLYSVALPNYYLQSSAAAASVALQQRAMEPDNYALMSYAGIEIAVSTINATIDRTEYLNVTTFTTAIGDIAFDEKGDLKINPFALVQLQNGVFKPVAATSQ